MIEEHDRVVLTTKEPDAGLEPGDVGTVVHVYSEGEAFEVEFVTLTGDTVAMLAIDRDEVRPVQSRELTHARSVE
ncbi:DUF4926 domain-containing protein [Salinibacter ruber]|jgi:hypothetical protein|uniref:DUF4926 domain-containing protein n=1 Tax=Salinibacter ruber (strain DSM 13855 / M31) TaxID=309807 RepID=Q2S4U9_SALRD|nr:DUF4926 domain-containing protein [Salinibacter ruber]ABC44530.1 conserved hypothetical protein [Salinibacter ruber DSM 13855]MCS3632223.1 hypothetical protein [Salinibacter ruber]MCS3638904.1 hypothetical protein [Salinibacter ruber]MCS3663390.1 hypothetical protein [Salinibacter ruber]MCS4053143.1 hypothetical protein [Salinibacter ruber]